jgi:hypothetical protein
MADQKPADGPRAAAGLELSSPMLLAPLMDLAAIVPHSYRRLGGHRLARQGT